MQKSLSPVTDQSKLNFDELRLMNLEKRKQNFWYRKDIKNKEKKSLSSQDVNPLNNTDAPENNQVH